MDGDPGDRRVELTDLRRRQLDRIGAKLGLCEAMAGASPISPKEQAVLVGEGAGRLERAGERKAVDLERSGDLPGDEARKSERTRRSTSS